MQFKNELTNDEMIKIIEKRIDEYKTVLANLTIVLQSLKNNEN